MRVFLNFLTNWPPLQPLNAEVRQYRMAAFSALVAMVLTTSLRPEDPPEIEVQPTVIEREIEFNGQSMEFGGEPLRLVGTLTLPTHYDAPHPAVLLISGAAGPAGRSPLAEDLNGMMTEIAHHLANKGFASFRYEHRSALRYDDQMPFPASDLSKASSAWDFSRHREDAGAAYDVLRKQAEVRTDLRPLILGHHFGGTLALSVTPTRRPAGLILLSTPGRPVRESLVRQYTAWVQVSGYPEEERAIILANLEPTLQALEERNDGLADSHRFWTGIFTRTTVGFYHGIFRARPIQAAASFKGPLLVAQGERDTLVDPEADAAELAMFFNRMRPDSTTLWVIPGVDHYFRGRANGGTGGNSGPMHPALFQGIDNYLDQHFPREN